jgi:hypothetical protein
MDFHEVFSLKSTMVALVQLNETGAHPNDLANADPTMGNLER